MKRPVSRKQAPSRSAWRWITGLLALLSVAPGLPAAPTLDVKGVSALRSVAYYRFQRPLRSLELEDFRDDLERMRGVGFNTVWIVVPWRELSPVALPEAELAPEVWQKLDAVLERLGAYGFFVVFPLGYFGRGWSPGGLPEARLAEWVIDPAMWGAYEAHVLRLTRRYAACANVLWLFYGESVIQRPSAFEGLAQAEASFRDYCRQANPDIAHWNARWHTVYPAIDDIGMEEPGALRWEDHFRWLCDLMRTRFGTLARTLKRDVGIRGLVGFHDDAMITLDWAKGDTPVPADNPYDVLSFVAYLDADTPIGERMAGVQATLDRFRAQYPKVPMMIGESGVPTLVRDEATQAAYLEAIADFVRAHGLGLNVWMWQDFEGASREQRSFGLLRVDGSAKPAVERLGAAFRAMDNGPKKD